MDRAQAATGRDISRMFGGVFSPLGSVALMSGIREGRRAAAGVHESVAAGVPPGVPAVVHGSHQRPPTLEPTPPTLQELRIGGLVPPERHPDPVKIPPVAMANRVHDTVRRRFGLRPPAAATARYSAPHRRDRPRAGERRDAFHGSSRSIELLVDVGELFGARQVKENARRQPARPCVPQRIRSSVDSARRARRAGRLGVRVRVDAEAESTMNHPRAPAEPSGTRSKRADTVLDEPRSSRILSIFGAMRGPARGRDRFCSPPTEPSKLDLTP